MRNLAIVYLSGDGVVKDQGKAAEWFGKGAATGDPISAYNLGLMLQLGVLGVPDLDAAAVHMRAAAEAGFAPAMTGLGLLIHRGAQGPEVPADWFERAAKAGDPQGRFLYAIALSEGDGRERDNASALVLLDDLLADVAAPPELQAQAKKLKSRIKSK
jgi:TPR repeat protein